MYLGRRETTCQRRCQNDQNTLKFGQKYHFYATILARRHQNGPRRRQMTSPDPGVSTGMQRRPVLLLSCQIPGWSPWPPLTLARHPLSPLLQ